MLRCSRFHQQKAVSKALTKGQYTSTTARNQHVRSVTYTDKHTSANEKLLAIDLECVLCTYCHGKLHTEIQHKDVKKAESFQKDGKWRKRATVSQVNQLLSYSRKEGGRAHQRVRRQHHLSEKKKRAHKRWFMVWKSRESFSILMFEAVKTNTLSETNWSCWNHI